MNEPPQTTARPACWERTEGSTAMNGKRWREGFSQSARRRKVMVRSHRILFALAMVGGCGATEETPAPVSAADREGPSNVEMVAAMEGHYTSAILAHDALIQGDLDAFRARLADLDTHELPPNSPDLWKPFDAQLHAAARRAGKATDLTTAANALASVALACGTCHQNIVVGPVYPVPPLNEQAQPLKAEMRDHQWATLMLWDGVTGPSAYAWDRGSRELAKARFFGDGRSVDEADDSLVQREAALRGLGEEAQATTALPARAMLYGRMLATCGGCHRAVGVELSAYKSSPPPLRQ